MLVPRLQDHLGIVAPASCARPDGGRGAAHSRRRAGLSLPAGQEAGKAARPGGGCLPGAAAGRRRETRAPRRRCSSCHGDRGTPGGGRGGTPRERPRPRRSSAPDARPGRPARTRGLPARAGANPVAALRPRSSSGPARKPAGASALTAFRVRPPVSPGVAGRQGLLGTGAAGRSFDPIKAARGALRSPRVPGGVARGVWTREEALGNDRAGALCLRSAASVARPLEGERERV